MSDKLQKKLDRVVLCPLRAYFSHVQPFKFSRFLLLIDPALLIIRRLNQDAIRCQTIRKSSNKRGGIACFSFEMTDLAKKAL